MREALNHKITVATLNGKSYYKIINTLKLLQLNYEELSPSEAVNSYSRIIITSKEESPIFKKKNIMVDSELNENPVIIKAKILRKLIKSHTYDQLTIGIDPGNRIGISIFYLHDEIESVVLSTIELTLNFIIEILSEIKAKKKIVRIGDGNINMARSIAFLIKANFKDLVHVEIVNEHGTSSIQNNESNRRILKDKSSARLIAFRNGKIFDPKLDRN
ncbi:MAG TPA: hypothetical protein VFC05_12135 [Nitrososphaeraceae archaeon]|jgi:hypothetical protein|nr:hypothetical protein [Nitrososphaeraceae archaeon]